MRVRKAAVVGVAVGVALGLVWVGGVRSVGRVEANDRAELEGWSAQQKAAQSAQVSGAAAPTIQVYSRETVVDVTVTDEKGNPVHGLTKADFTVLEDGKAQALRSFEEFSKAMPGTTSAQRKLPPNTYTNVQTATGPLYVLLDGGKWAEQFIKNLPPGTRHAQLTDGGRLTVLQDSTEPALRPGMVIGINPIRIPPGLIGCPRQVLFDWYTLDELNEIATYLSGIPGKKNLIWVGSAMSDLVWDGCQLWSGPLQETYDLLEDAQITIYPVDPSGVVAPLPPRVSGDPSSYGEQAATQNADVLAGVAKNHLTLEAVAESTGGQAFYNTNDIAAAIGKAVDAGASYYTLSYAPHSVEYDGRYHTISINVTRPNVHLLYRKGYSAVDPALIEHPPEKLFGIVTRDTRPSGPAATPIAAAMAPIAPPATQLLFDVHIEPSAGPARAADPAVIGFLDEKLKGKPLTRYDLVYSVTPSQVAFSDPGDGTYRGVAEFDVVAYDALGKQVTMLRQTLTMPLSVDAYADFVQKPFEFRQQIDLPEGRMFVRVGILDKVSNKVGTMEIPLTVKAAAVVAGK